MSAVAALDLFSRIPVVSLLGFLYASSWNDQATSYAFPGLIINVEIWPTQGV
jgi:hypothetical protein